MLGTLVLRESFLLGLRFQRVMTDKERSNLHSNTAKLLKFADGIVQKDYLIQVSSVKHRS